MFSNIIFTLVLEAGHTTRAADSSVFVEIEPTPPYGKMFYEYSAWLLIVLCIAQSSVLVAPALVYPVQRTWVKKNNSGTSLDIAAFSL